MIESKFCSSNLYPHFYIVATKRNGGKSACLFCRRHCARLPPPPPPPSRRLFISSSFFWGAHVWGYPTDGDPVVLLPSSSPPPSPLPSSPTPHLLFRSEVLLPPTIFADLPLTQPGTLWKCAPMTSRGFSPLPSLDLYIDDWFVRYTLYAHGCRAQSRLSLEGGRAKNQARNLSSAPLHRASRSDLSTKTIPLHGSRNLSKTSQ